jgi:hypothetical protein
MVGNLRNGLVVLGLLFVPTLEMFFFMANHIDRIVCFVIKLALNGILTAQCRFDFSLKIENPFFKRIWGVCKWDAINFLSCRIKHRWIKLPSSEHLLRGLVITIGLFTNGGIIVVM